jgi:arginine decarboxylase
VIGAAVAVGVPEDPTLPGLIMEYHATAPIADVKAEVREMVVQGMAFRQRAIKDILVIGAEHVVDKHGGAFAGVVLWDDSRREP